MELSLVDILVEAFNMVSINVLVIVVLAIVLLSKRKSLTRNQSVTGAFRSLQYLNTKAEQNFFTQINRSLPNDVLLLAKVRLADICVPKDPKNIRDFNKVSRKHIDFVLVQRSNSQILACIELDDSSHAKRSAKKGDRIKNDALKAAGVPLFRVPASRSYSGKLRQIEMFLAERSGETRQEPSKSNPKSSEPVVQGTKRDDRNCPHCQVSLNRVDMKWPNKGQHFYSCPGCSYRTDPVISHQRKKSDWYNPKEFRKS